MIVTSNITRKSRIARAAAALAVALAMIFGAPAALADLRTVTGNVDSQAIAAINPDRTVRLTMIKTPPSRYDGVSASEIPAGVISGVTFTVSRVDGVDLTTEEGWALARDMTVAQAKERGFTLTRSAVTDVDGEAVFTELPIGLYLVTETAPANPGPGYIGSNEFLITLPTGGDDGKNWNYDVTVKAKNKVPSTTTPTTPTPPVTTTPEVPTTPVTPAPSTTPAPPTKPGKPAPTTTPGAPVPSKPSGPGGLASTGANVAWLAAAALLLIGGGAFLVQRRRR